MKSKFIYLSDQQVERITKDALDHETSFTEMVRRILDYYYEEIRPDGERKPGKGKKQ